MAMTRCASFMQNRTHCSRHPQGDAMPVSLCELAVALRSLLRADRAHCGRAASSVTVSLTRLLLCMVEVCWAVGRGPGARGDGSPAGVWLPFYSVIRVFFGGPALH